MALRTDMQREPEDEVVRVLIRLLRDPGTPAPSRRAAVFALRDLADSVSLTDGAIIFDVMCSMLNDNDTDTQVAAITVVTVLRRQRLRWRPRNVLSDFARWLFTNPTVLVAIIAGIPFAAAVLAAILYTLASGVRIGLNLLLLVEIIVGLILLIASVNVVVMYVRMRRLRLRQLSRDLNRLPRGSHPQRYTKGATPKSRRAKK